MSGALTIDAATRARQDTATNPVKSIWVSANAGSGKTYVLSRRVIRLLLEGSRPSELLCLTFTKAAAAEMSNRVFSILGQWTMMGETELLDAIGELTGEKPSSDQLIRARKLFALALDTPGGLRIQTIHAFCESLLHQFPLEANIPGNFAMADDVEQQSLIAEAQRRVALASEGIIKLRTYDERTAQEKTELLQDCFRVVREHASESKIESAIRQLISQRDEFTEWLRRNGRNAQQAMKPAWDEFGFKQDETVRSLYASFQATTNYDAPVIDHLLELFQSKGGTKADDLFALFSHLRSETDPEAVFNSRWQIHFRKDGEPGAGFISKKFMSDHDLWDTYLAEQSVLAEQMNRVKTLRALKASEALFTIGEAILNEYASLKQRRGLLDFGDLITKTVNLLSRSEIADWVQYKLDKGISHVLVDEAQDTSPQQWKVIEAITGEFYAGAGAREQIRTTFIVGDEKQSIFSFQGADPEEFDRQRRALHKKAENARLSHEAISLDLSFRSTQEVLSAVDQVFSLPENAQGLTDSGKKLSHTASRRGDQGEVIIWPMDIKPRHVERTDWRDPPDDESLALAEITLANRIASTIRGWLDKGEYLPGQENPISPGDILILVRKRDRFVNAMNRALKAADLDSAGADRLKLNTHIAIEDMIALGRFACMSLDDLALAGLLKSPLFSLTEAELFDVCADRGDAGLFAHLSALASHGNPRDLPSELYAKVQHANELLAGILDNGSQRTVHGFYAGLFAQTGLREKYLARLGSEVEDVLDGFLQSAIDFDDHSGLGLQVFVESIVATEPELKREIDTDSNQIRVITAHSSKGLEAPIVFLVDPGSKPFSTAHAPDVVTIPDKNQGKIRLWQPTTGDRIAETETSYQQIEAAAEAEYRRLLYVGMTRAGDRLVVCGYRQEKAPDYLHWHKMVMSGLEAAPADPGLKGRLVPTTGKDHEALRWIIDNPDQKDVARIDTLSADKRHAPKLPDWISRIPREPGPPRPLTPSGVLDLLEIREQVAIAWDNDNSIALERGNAVHHLLQILPQGDQEKRKRTIARYFDITSFDFSEEHRNEISRMVLSILEHPDCSALFAPGSRSEVEVTGTILIADKKHMIRGKIDRLAITDDRVLIADYKTNQNVPDRAEDVSADYLSQMALYRSLVSDLYQNRKIVCQLIWTTSGRVMTLPDQLLDRQIAQINSLSQQDVSNGFLTPGTGIPN